MCFTCTVTGQRQKTNSLYCTFAFSMHGQRVHAALDWTSALGFFNKDHTRRTPSSWSMILLDKGDRKVAWERRVEKKEQMERNEQGLCKKDWKKCVISIRSFIKHQFLLERFKSVTEHVWFSELWLYQPSQQQAIDFSIGSSPQLAFGLAQFLSRHETYPQVCSLRSLSTGNLGHRRARG